MDIFNFDLSNMHILLKTFWFIAIPSSLIFLIQAIMTFIGADTFDNLDLEIEMDSESSDFQYFSFRNLINFLLGFSWTGIALFPIWNNIVFLVLISLLVGLGFVYLYFIIIKQIYKLNQDNTFKITDTIMKTGEVYLNIPPNMTGKGKVLISSNGSLHELDAMTESELINANSKVVVVRVEDNILIVEQIEF